MIGEREERGKKGIYFFNRHPCEATRTSWLDTSAWSFLVMPSPMADFISRDNEGSTLIGG